MSVVEAEIARFLAKRLVGDAGARGLSSDALIASAVLGEPPAWSPSDMSDFGRCCEAIGQAPWELQKRMLPWIVAWGQKMQAKYPPESA